MICPLLSKVVNYEGNLHQVLPINCLEKECAWWIYKEYTKYGDDIRHKSGCALKVIGESKVMGSL